MRLKKLHTDDREVFLEYLRKLRSAFGRVVLTEGHKITIEIDDEGGISTSAKNEFVQQAEKLGNFDDPIWVEQLVNGMKQVGVQGMNTIGAEAMPVTRSEVKKLIEALVKLVNKRK